MRDDLKQRSPTYPARKEWCSVGDLEDFNPMGKKDRGSGSDVGHHPDSSGLLIILGLLGKEFASLRFGITRLRNSGSAGPSHCAGCPPSWNR